MWHDQGIESDNANTDFVLWAKGDDKLYVLLRIFTELSTSLQPDMSECDVV